MPVTETPVTPYRVSRLTKHSSAPGTPTTSVATHGEPKRPSLDERVVHGLGPGLVAGGGEQDAGVLDDHDDARVDDREGHAEADEGADGGVAPRGDHAADVAAREGRRSGAPMVMAMTGTRMITVEMARVVRTVRATLRRGLSSSSER